MAKEVNVIRRDQEADEGRSADRIRDDIAATRDDIAVTVDKLTDRVQETLDWKSYVERHPLAAIGVAAGAGLLISGVVRKRSTPTERILKALADSVEDTTGRVRGTLSLLPGSGMRPQNAVKAALIGLLARKASEYVEEHFAQPRPKRQFGEDDRRHVVAAETQPQYEQQGSIRRNHGTDDEQFS
jgi:ElaB/YqjD/DUF883 family membrane-anchored ribosome-binding protein